MKSEKLDDLSIVPEGDRFGVLKRRVNESADPVMSFNEVVSMLEDFSVIPGLLRRGDVQKVYNLSYSGPAKGNALPSCRRIPSSARMSAFHEIMPPPNSYPKYHPDNQSVVTQQHTSSRILTRRSYGIRTSAGCSCG